jgi:adenosine deaminase
MHCDPRQERSLDHLWQCLDVVGVDRIDHGVECLADDRLVSELVRRRLGLTVCPLSNLRLYGDLMGDAVTEMLRRELLVTVNSDDPAYFGGYVADNYRAVADEAHLDRAALVRLARNSFEAAWLAPERRSVYLQQLDDYVAAA